VPFHPTFVSQGAAFGQYLLDNRPNATIAIQYLKDDLGRDFLRGFKSALGDQATKLIIREVSHEQTDPTVDGQIVELKATGAEVLVQFTTTRFIAQGIRKVAELGWKLTYIIAATNYEPGSLPRSCRRLSSKAKRRKPNWIDQLESRDNSL
jgi:branched-chain amino acid transport system substrate-binding protein